MSSGRRSQRLCSASQSHIPSQSAGSSLSQRPSQFERRSQCHRSSRSQDSSFSQRPRQFVRRSQPQSSSQPQPSTSSDSPYSESSHSRSTLVENCVQALLVLHQNKHPIKKSDLTKQVFRHNGKMFKTIMEECDIILQNIYGFKLVEVPEKSQYILINNISITDPSLSQRNREENIERGILLTVLSVIFMSGGELKEDKLYQFLEKLGFDTDSKSPMEFLHCSIVELVTQKWVRQLYLKHEKVEYSEPLEYIFRWGFRAETELKKVDVLKFVCEIWGDKATPEKWRKQWASAHART